MEGCKNVQSLASFSLLTRQRRAKRLSVLFAVGLGSLWGCLWTGRAIAQTAELTRAEVYSLQNTVELLQQDQSPRQAQLQDALVPLDAMRTGNRSRAELLFNEGSLARLGSHSVFRFLPGLRRYQLPDGSVRSEAVIQLRSGTLAMMVPPGSGGGSDGIDTTVETPEGEIRIFAYSQPPEALGGEPDDTVALFIVSDPNNNQVQIISLTDVVIQLPSEVLPVLLEGGQTVTVIDGQLGEVQTFDLRRFYQTSGLAVGLGPDQEDELASSPEAIQLTLRAMRPDTLAAIARQDNLQVQSGDPEGLCTVDARGRDTTSTRNCISTEADDPLSEFEDRRGDSLEPELPEEPPIIDDPQQPENEDPIPPGSGPMDPQPGNGDNGQQPTGPNDPGGSPNGPL